MPVEHERIKRDIEIIAGFTETPGNGASRPTFSVAWGSARDYLLQELRGVNAKVRIDAAGNVHARLSGLDWDEPVWASGSHLDSVPHGGNYDGVMGVVVPLELMRAAHEEGRNDFPLELVAFAEEEGPTFGLGMLGSRALVGDLDADELSQVINAEGENYLQAGFPYGVVPDRVGREKEYLTGMRGFIEVHAEQGPGLWKEGQPVALVTAIAGRHQYNVSLSGQANHAGSTAMLDRRDALVGAAEVILSLESLAAELSTQTVITVGEIHCQPNAVNVIPGSVAFRIDFRSPDNALLGEGEKAIFERIQEVAERRALELEIERTEAIAAVSLDRKLANEIQEAARREDGMALPEVASGALHDAAVVASHVPTVMLFVASKDGISHNSGEFSRSEDITRSAMILWRFLHEN